MKDLIIVRGPSVTTMHHHRRRQHGLRSTSSGTPESIHSIATYARTLPLLPFSQPSVPTISPSSLCVCAVRRNSTVSLDQGAEIDFKLAGKGRFDELAAILEQMAVSGGDLSRFEARLSGELLVKGISINLTEKKAKDFLAAMKRIEKRGIVVASLFDKSATKVLRRHVNKLIDSHKVEEVVDMMEILSGFGFKVRELADPSIIVKACVDYCGPNTAISYAGLLPHAEILFCKIIGEYGRKRDMESVLEAYEACKQKLDTPNMYIYRTLIDACGLCGNYLKSRYIYEDIIKQRVTPNIYVLNSLMNVNSLDLEYSLSVYKNMQRLGISPDMTSYNILLKACCLAGRVDLAQDIYKEAKRLEFSGGLKLDAFTYCTIIKVFADARLWKMALKVKEDMLSAGVTPKNFTWSSLISACANAGLVEQSVQLFDEMLQTGCQPNSQCFNTLLHACVEACQYDRAFRLFRSWEGNGALGNIMEDNENQNKKILTMSEQASKSDSISNWGRDSYFGRMSPPKRFFKPTTATYNILLKACGTDFYRARALLHEMKSIGLAPNHISWSTMIDICGSSGNLENALQILRTMNAAGSKPDVVAYTTAIKVCVESKNLKLAFSLFEEMRKYCIKPNLVTYNTLLRARSRYGSLDEVRQCLAVYQDMRRQGYKPNDYYLKELIEEWCEGVIQESDLNQDETPFKKRISLGRPQSLVIEKVAAHLQKSTAENLVIDLRGLTKVEARIVILAVLRMIKESHIQGEPLKDDMVVILGKGVVNPNMTKLEIGMQDAVIQLLRDELGLQVVSAQLKSSRKTELVSNDQDPVYKLGDTSTSKDNVIESTRRPAILQRLKVPKRTLYRWLQRRANVLRK